LTVVIATPQSPDAEPALSTMIVSIAHSFSYFLIPQKLDGQLCETDDDIRAD
jgi:hypothetical protein